MPDIFLCYRSGDDAYAAALIDEKLSQAFGAPAIFRASRSILPGETYSEAIFRALDRCTTVLVIVGSTWAERLHANSTSPEDDWVRVEIAKALNSAARVIPVLLSRTPRLERLTLPPEIADLAEKQYLKFEHRNVHGDIEQMITALRQTTPRPDREEISVDGVKPAHHRFRGPSPKAFRRIAESQARDRRKYELTDTAASRSKDT